MEQSRQRVEEKLIITGNRSTWRFITDVTLTLFFWAYTLLVITFFLSSILGVNTPLTRILNLSFNTTNSQVRVLILIGLIVFICFYALLSVNRFYNKKRFGSLNRRTYPPAVTRDELISLQLIDSDTINLLQKENYIVFEENPIISLDKKRVK